MKPLNTAIVGLGGIGVHVARAMASWLAYRHPGSRLTLIDADTWEARNLERVADAWPGMPKVEAVQAQLGNLRGRINIEAIPFYLTDLNAQATLDGTEVIFGCPDNHPTRRLIEVYAASQRTITAILGGNEGADDPSGGTYGSVVIYRRENGVDLTPPPSLAHPELMVDPAITRKIGCELQIPSTPQLLFTNMAVATAMLSLFYTSQVSRAHPAEVNLDVASCRHLPIVR